MEIGAFSRTDSLRFRVVGLIRLAATSGMMALCITLAYSQGPEVTNVPLANNAIRCGPGSVALVSSGCAAGNSPRWFADVALTKEVSSETLFITPVLQETTYYHVACVYDQNSELKGKAVQVSAIVKPKLVVTLMGEDSVCEQYSRSYQGVPSGGNFSLSVVVPIDYYIISDKTLLVLLPGSGVNAVPFSYTYTDPATGCSATAFKTSVSLPIPELKINSPIICEGDSAILTVENCHGTISWFGVNVDS